MPVLTRHMTPADYGQVTIFTMNAGVISTFALLNLHGALSTNYYKFGAGKSKIFAQHCALICASIFVILFVSAITFPSSFRDVMQLPESLIAPCFILAGLQVVLQFGLTINQMQQRAKSYALAQVTLSALNALLSIVFVIAIQNGATGRITGIICAYAIVACFLAIRLVRDGWIALRLSVSLDDIRTALAFGIPLLPHSFANLIGGMADKYFVNRMMGSGQTGIYNVAFQVGTLIALLQTGFNQAWVPWMFKTLAACKAEDKRTIVKFTYLYGVCLFSLVVLVGFSSKLYMPLIAGEEFQAAAPIIFWVGLAGAFDGMYKMVGNYLFYVQKTGVLSTITTASVVLNLLLTPLAVRKFGSIGAAYALASCNFFYFIAVWAASAYYFPMPWSLRDPNTKAANPVNT